ncbi:ribonuclease M5 [Cohnella ginsengisoli]|uniref:Ribonuclease M5 n=2 Tax=Cohnella ginsengisoli TaxID=425004 RepID=A0A9X4KN03_9BACL|nr:ribonuclease M5 [Cohnella ginsengisoli]MDG0795282.1 ribonuclease M5 [Cohnella ginsengisoli]
MNGASGVNGIGLARIAEMIVVEGKEDTVAIRRAVDADTIETGGSAIDDKVLRRIELARERRGVIIFTDPDVPGEKIRKIIEARVPGCSHAFLAKADARGKDGIGVEHARPEAIRAALARVRASTGGSASAGADEATSQPGVATAAAASETAKAGASGAVQAAAAGDRDRAEAGEPAIAWPDLIDAGLIVHPAAASRRERMGELLGIGYANGKQFYKRLGMFRITRAEFAEALRQLTREGVGE